VKAGTLGRCCEAAIKVGDTVAGLEHGHCYVGFGFGGSVTVAGSEETTCLDDIIAGSTTLDTDETTEATAMDG
jgi:hypothetical protein